MSIRQENNGNYMGDASKTEADKGKKVPIPSAGIFKEGMSGIPAGNGGDNYPKQGRINFGKDKISNA
jgi:hypothetical protein